MNGDDRAAAPSGLPPVRLGGAPPDGLADTQDLLDALDAATIGYAVTDADGRVLTTSAPYRRIAAVAEGRLMEGVPWFELDASDEAEKTQRRALWAAFKQSGRTWIGWVRWHLPSGRIRYFEGTAKPIANARYLLIANDRSDSIEADRALEDSEAALQAVLNDLPVSVSLLSPDGTILYINHFLPERTGLSPEDLIGRDFDAVEGLVPDTRFSAGLREALAREQRIDAVDVHLTEGSLADTYWLFFGRPLYGRDGRMQRYLSVSVERTAERRLIEERRRFAAAIAENQKIGALNDFAGSLAHELANVLQPVGVYARRLARDVGAPEAEAHAHRIDAAVRDAGRILRRTLSMARGTEGTAGRRDIAGIVREVVENARDLAPKPLSYDLECPPAAMGAFQATELRQVLLNLLNNAAEAQHYVGRVRVALRGPGPGPDGPPVAPTATGPFWRLDVTDEGEGMTPDVRARVFEPFFTTKKAGRGTGLGLPVVLGLVTGWGGTVTVRSAPGEGSAFTIWIPAALPAVTEGPGKEAGRQDGP